MLDVEQINRAAPPGSLRYFALLYAPAEKRTALAALFIIDAEIKTSATQVSHDVAHTRMQWWRAEIDRLINRNAQHPATKTLQESASQIPFAQLHELMVAADMDLSRMTYNSERELNVYLDRSGGVLGELSAQHLLDAPELDSVTRATVRSLFVAIRRTETLRDLSRAARAGRIYWPMDELDHAQLSVNALSAATTSNELRQLIKLEADRLRTTLSNALQTLPTNTRAALRPLLVLGALHAQILKSITRTNYDVTQPCEIGALNKVWTAWRAARRA